MYQMKNDAGHVCEGQVRLSNLLKIAIEALEGFRLGHEHAPGFLYTRPMGDTYGWCDHCHGRVSWGPGEAEQALEQIYTGLKPGTKEDK